MNSSVNGNESVENSSGVTNKYTVNLNNAKIDSLRAAGYSDAQIEALLSLADPDDQGNSLAPTHFYSVNKQTLNALKYTGELNENSKRLVYLQAPIALVQEISNPANWQGDNYVGSGAAEVNAYLLGEPVDFTKPTLDAMIMSVLTARAEILQVQLEEQIKSIELKNDTLKQANDWLAKAKKAKEQGASAMTPEMINFWKSMNAEYIPSGLNATKWDANIQGLKSKIETLTSQSQLETTKLQQTINKYNQTFEMLSNFINKYFQSISTIIQNMR